MHCTHKSLYSPSGQDNHRCRAPGQSDDRASGPKHHPHRAAIHVHGIIQDAKSDSPQIAHDPGRLPWAIAHDPGAMGRSRRIVTMCSVSFLDTLRCTWTTCGTQLTPLDPYLTTMALCGVSSQKINNTVPRPAGARPATSPYIFFTSIADFSTAIMAWQARPASRIFGAGPRYDMSVWRILRSQIDQPYHTWPTCSRLDASKPLCRPETGCAPKAARLGWDALRCLCMARPV